MVPDQRRLAAIISADVAGYSRLMGTDESGTLAALKRHRRELIDPKVAEFGGRIVKTTGDGLLLEFPSVVDAIRCAVDVQRAMAARNADVPADQRIEFRIGINVGDIIIDGDDIFGDGVNVAARLQAIADPGGIYVSSVVRDQVASKVGMPFEDLGQRTLKNITEPIHVFRVGIGVSRQQVGDRLPGVSRTGRTSLAYAVGAFAIASVVVGIWFAMRTATTPSSTANPAPPSSIALLPFKSPQGDSTIASLADKVTNDLGLALSNSMRSSLVLTPTGAHEPRKPIDPRSLGQELRVRYLVDGDLQPIGDRVVVTVRIVEADSARQIGGDRREIAASSWDRDRGAFIAAVVSLTREAVGSADSRRVLKGKMAHTPAELVEQGWGELGLGYTVEHAREARRFHDRALELDPRYVPAWIGRGWTFVAEFENDWTDTFDRERVVRELDEASRRAIDLDDRDARAWRLRAIALGLQWRHSGALEAIDRGRKLDPTRADLVFQRALVLFFMGKPKEVLETIDEHNALGASGDPAVLRLACNASLMLGRYDEAIEQCERAVALENYWPAYLTLTATYSLSGDMVRAANARSQLLQSAPGFTISRLKRKQFSINPDYVKFREQVLYPALDKAGVPE